MRKWGPVLRLGWESFREGLAFLLPWLLLPLLVGLFFLGIRALVLLWPERTPLIVLLDRLGQAVGWEASLAALLAALLGFAVKMWESAKKDVRERTQEARTEIDQLGQLLQQGKMADALRFYRQLCRRREAIWSSEPVQNYLQRTWKQSAPEPLRRFQECLGSLERGKHWPRLRRRAPRKEVRRKAEALLWASQNLDEESHEQATAMMSEWMAADTIAEISQVIEEKEEDEGVRVWLQDARFGRTLEKIASGQDEAAQSARTILDIRARPAPTPPLWRGERPPDSPEMKDILRELGLKSNPFGPLVAEQDPELPNYWVEPPDWPALCRVEPTLVVGKDGCGKTAAAFRLAHRFWKEDRTVLPVYTDLTLQTDLEEPWPALLPKLLADALAVLFGRDPFAFLNQERPQKETMAQFLSLRFGSQEALANRLQREGLSCTEGVGARLFQQVVQLGGTAARGKMDERAWLERMGQARPAGRKETVFLLEIAPEMIHRQPAGKPPAAQPDREVPSIASPPVVEEALRQLLERLGRNHPRYSDALTLQYRLLDNLARSRLSDDDEGLRSERSEIVARLNELSRAAAGVWFNEICGWVASEQALGESVGLVPSRPLLDLVEPLSQKGVYLKVFVPEAPETIRWKWSRVKMVWSEDQLRELLERRLTYAGQPAGLHALGKAENTDDLLVRLARGSPRRLIELGNALLSQVGQHPGDPSIRPEDLEYLEQTYGATAD